MWTAAILRPSTPHDMSVAIDNDTPDRRVWPHPSKSARSQAQRQLHEGFIALEKRTRDQLALCLRFVQLPEDMFKILGLAKILVHGRKAHIGHSIQVPKPLHHQFANR